MRLRDQVVRRVALCGEHDDVVPGASWEQVTADLSEFAGEATVYVALRHYNSVDKFRGYADLFDVYGKVIETEPEEPVVEPVEVEAERVGDMGVYNYSNGGAMAWDHTNHVLYLVSNYNATQDYDHYLWVVDTKTGAATRANSVSGSGNTSTNPSARLYGCVNGLFIVPGTVAVVEPTDVATDLTVEPTEINMFKGQTREIKVAVMPWTLTDKDVTFASDNENVATVDDRGTVTSTGIGTATITVTTVAKAENGEPLTATVTVNVNEPPAAELRGIIWDENPDVGDRVNITVIATGFQITKLTDITDVSLGKLIIIGKDFVYDRNRELSSGDVAIPETDSGIIKVGFSTAENKRTFHFTDENRPVLLVSPDENLGELENTAAIRRVARPNNEGKS